MSLWSRSVGSNQQTSAEGTKQTVYDDKEVPQQGHHQI